jgi:hypothetical protein
VSDRRREKDLKRKLRQQERDAKGAAPSGTRAPSAAPSGKEVVARELADPQRLMVHLRRLSELLTGVEELRAARIAPAKLVPALLALPPDELAALPEAERPLKLREKLIPALVEDSIARTARNAFEATLNRAKAEEDRLALVAGRMFMDHYLRTKQAPNVNPAWEAVFGISLLDSVFEGHLMSRIVRDSWDLDETQIAKALARALARAEVAAELESLGLVERDPETLAKQYVALSRQSEKTYLLGFDAMLHLVHGNAELAAGNVKTLLAEGATSGVRKAALDMFEDAFKNDMTKPLADDLTSEITKRLEAIKKGDAGGPKPRNAESPEEEKRVALTALLALRAFPIDKNVFLRSTYLGSFDVYKNVAPVEEVPFIRRVWAEPTDRWALEEYEKFLLERRHSHRAGRVRRYLQELRAEARSKP